MTDKINFEVVPYNEDNIDCSKTIRIVGFPQMVSEYDIGYMCREWEPYYVMRPTRRSVLVSFRTTYNALQAQKVLDQMPWEDCVAELPEEIKEECSQFCHVTPSWYQPERYSSTPRKDNSKDYSNNSFNQCSIHEILSYRNKYCNKEKVQDQNQKQFNVHFTPNINDKRTRVLTVEILKLDSLLFVGNIGDDVDAKELERLFKQYGHVVMSWVMYPLVQEEEVEEIKSIKDKSADNIQQIESNNKLVIDEENIRRHWIRRTRDVGKRRKNLGYGYVLFADKDSSKVARVKLNKTYIGQRLLRVEPCYSLRMCKLRSSTVFIEGLPKTLGNVSQQVIQLLGEEACEKDGIITCAQIKNKDEKELIQFIQQIAPVSEYQFPRLKLPGPHNYNSRGFAYITFQNPIDAELVCRIFGSVNDPRYDELQPQISDIIQNDFTQSKFLFKGIKLHLSIVAPWIERNPRTNIYDILTNEIIEDRYIMEALKNRRKERREQIKAAKENALNSALKENEMKSEERSKTIQISQQQKPFKCEISLPTELEDDDYFYIDPFEEQHMNVIPPCYTPPIQIAQHPIQINSYTGLNQPIPIPFNPHLQPNPFNPHLQPNPFNPHLQPNPFNPHLQPIPGGIYNTQLQQQQFQHFPFRIYPNTGMIIEQHSKHKLQRDKHQKSCNQDKSTTIQKHMKGKVQEKENSSNPNESTKNLKSSHHRKTEQIKGNISVKRQSHSQESGKYKHKHNKYEGKKDQQQVFDSDSDANRDVVKIKKKVKSKHQINSRERSETQHTITNSQQYSPYRYTSRIRDRTSSNSRSRSREREQSPHTSINSHRQFSPYRYTSRNRDRTSSSSRYRSREREQSPYTSINSYRQFSPYRYTSRINQNSSPTCRSYSRERSESLQYKYNTHRKRGIVQYRNDLDEDEDKNTQSNSYGREFKREKRRIRLQ
ncbi:MAG: hypothetical protein EZS28_018128 [Streblomastix strix]|uniref:RRM domain-containing protein n=1 Tax=Streblomastix strix TaxID=222440 RepID=A0A5J4VUH1_9EUKA|nr:MAG: hypothetical protein EZS28_018128 [Streblomastix strix]